MSIVAQLLSVVGYVLILYSLYRTFSRNYDRRRAENNKFLSITDPLTRNFRRMNAQARDRDHKYFRCPTCGQLLRVPKGKGRIHISCRNCGASFDKKTCPVSKTAPESHSGAVFLLLSVPPVQRDLDLLQEAVIEPQPLKALRQGRDEGG